MRFRLHRWYLDCVTPSGEVAIVPTPFISIPGNLVIAALLAGLQSLRATLALIPEFGPWQI